MIELFQVFADNIAPILLMAGVGFLVARFFPIDAKSISTLLYHVFSPALVFSSLYVSEISGAELLSLYAATLLFQVVLGAAAFIIMRLQGAGPVDRATVILGSIFANTGNYGLSLVSFAFGPEIFTRAIIVFIANTTLNYSLGVFVASNGKGSLQDGLRNILRTPAVYAIILAFALRGFDLQLPLALERSATRLGEAAIPLMLVLLGVQLRQFTQFSKLRYVVTGVGLRLLLSPFVAAGIALLLSLNANSYTAFVIQSSMPTAVISLIFATQFDLDRDLALNIILVSTLLSPVTLSVLILLMT